MAVDAHRRCEECGAPLDSDQRYCLTCGARVSARDPQLEGLLARLHDPGPAQAAPAEDLPASGDGGRLALRLPPAWVSTLLVLAFVGVGALLGSVAGSNVSNSLGASARRPLRVVLPAKSAAGGSSSSQESSAPAAEAESTPSESSEAGAGSAAASAPATGATSQAGQSSPGTSSGSAGGGSGSSGGGGGSSSGAGSGTPKIKHVFVVMLDNQPYASVFGPSSPAHYLLGLESKGALLARYYAVAHEQLANAIALISGQGPTVDTAKNCPTYEAVTPATVGAQGQVSGNGCVYPSGTETLAGQLTAKHLTWKAYLEGMDEGSGTAAGACAHPALGASDPSAAQPPPAGLTYATWRNPFVYFQSLTGSTACASNDVGMNELGPDLSNASRAPSFAYVVPDLCHDGNPNPCSPGAPAGMAAADTFLQREIPKIMASKAYKDGGLLVITVDEAPSSGEFADSSSCCGQPVFPNLPAGSKTGPLAEGGGQVGALLLSPLIKGGTISQEPYNHFSLLRSIEGYFDLSHLGYAGGSKVTAFEPSIFNAAGG